MSISMRFLNISQVIGTGTKVKLMRAMLLGLRMLQIKLMVWIIRSLTRPVSKFKILCKVLRIFRSMTLLIGLSRLNIISKKLRRNYCTW